MTVLHDPIIAIKENGEIVQANKMAEELFGYERNEFLQMSIEELLPSSLRHRHSQFRQVFIQQPRTGPMGKDRRQYPVINRAGEQLYVEVFLTPITGKEGKYIIATIRDVTIEATSRKNLINVIKESFSKTPP